MARPELDELAVDNSGDEPSEMAASTLSALKNSGRSRFTQDDSCCGAESIWG